MRRALRRRPAPADDAVVRCRCSGWSGTWPRWSAPGSGGCSTGRTCRWSGRRTGDFQAAYDAADAAPEEAFAAWQAEIAIARDIEAAAPSLDVTGVDRRSGDEYSLRRVLLHLIQEYARHNGHADLIREGIDGVTGV